MTQPMLVLGWNTRAAAQSALRAGYDPWCIDVANCRDMPGNVHHRTCRPEHFPFGLVDVMEGWPELPRGGETAAMVTGPLENHIALLEQLAARVRLWGAKPDATEAVRSPTTLAHLPTSRWLKPCEIRYRASVFLRIRRRLFSKWFTKDFLRKPLDSFDGQDICEWETGMPVSDEHYLQECVTGRSLGAVFAADGWSCHLVGVAEQLVGETATSIRPYAYAGSIFPTPLRENQREALGRLGVAMTQRHDLRGFFGIDLVVDRQGTLRPVELNPRYVQSIDLIERATNTPTMLTPPFKPPDDRKRRAMPDRVEGIHGCLVVRSDEPFRAPDLLEHLDATSLADIPHQDRSFAPGEAICTVCAQADDRDACLARLRDLAGQVLDA